MPSARLSVLLLTLFACLVPAICYAAGALAGGHGGGAGGPDGLTWTVTLAVPNIGSVAMAFMLRSFVRESLAALKTDLKEDISRIDSEVEKVRTTANTGALDISNIEGRLGIGGTCTRPVHL